MSTTNWTCPECETLNDASSEQCAVCGLPRPAEDSFSLPVIEATPRYSATAAAPEPKKPEKAKRGIMFWLLSLLCIIFAYTSFSTRQENDALRNTVRQQEEEIESLEDSLSDLRDSLHAANGELKDWEEAVESMSGKIPGYGDYYFKTDKGVLVISKGGSAQLTLTTAMNGKNTISCSESTSAAYVVFDQDNWYNSTTLTVHGKSAGLCILSFSASNYNKPFKVLVWVR